MKTATYWFITFWIVTITGIVLLLLLSGCTLPVESQNYSPATPYLWTEPGMWKEGQ